MKIGLFNYSDNSGGAARATYRIHKSLLKQGYNSTLYVNNKFLKDSSVKNIPYILDRNLYKIRTNLISKFIKITNPGIKSYYSLSLLSSNWPKFINDSDLDLVHLNWLNGEMMSIEDIAKITKPIVWTFHDMWPFLGSEHLSNNFNSLDFKNFEEKNFIYKIRHLNEWTYFRKKKSWTKPIHVITPSRWLEKCVKESELMNNWPIETIPHPIDVKFWKPDLKDNSRKNIGIDRNKIVLTFGADGGTEAYNKGFDLLLNSLEKIKDFDKNLILCIFGDEKKNKIINKFPVINFGKITNDEKLREIYRATDLLIVPSRSESFCQVALEAQSCGVPVLAFAVGGLLDIIKDDVTGYLVEPYDTNNFSLKIINFIKNKKIILI